MSIVYSNLIIDESISGNGTSTRAPARLATNVPGTLASDFEAGDTIDGVTLVTDDRILLKDQTSGVENGIYIVQSSGAPLRADDFAADDSAATSFIFVEEGTINSDTGWICTNNKPNDIIGTDSLSFMQFAGNGADGDMNGPGISTDNSIPRFDGITGTILQDSGVLLDDSDNITGVVGITASGTVSGNALLSTTSMTAASVILEAGVNDVTISATTQTSAASTINIPNLAGSGGDFVLNNLAQTLTNKTLTSPIISTIVNTGTLTLPTSTDTLVGRNTTDTLTNKTLTSPILTTPQINDTSLTHRYVIVPSEITANRNINLPILSSDDTFVFRTNTQTLLNKTISGTSNTITNLNANNISSGTLAVARGGTNVSTFGGTNTLLYTTAADTLASIATANNSILVTNGSGVPSISNVLPANLVLGSPSLINDSDASQQYELTGGALTAGGSANSTVTLPADGGSAFSDVFTLNARTQTLTNKTLTGTTNTIRATQLATTTADVVIDGATAPTAGQGLVASGGTAAIWQNISLGLFDAVVDPAGGADFTTINAAFTAGNITVFARSGSYTESSTIVIPNGGVLIGESKGDTIINLSGVSISADGSGGTNETAGSIAVTNGSTAVVGTGTTFTNLSSGDFISIGNNFYEIDTITNATNLDIVNSYQGNTTSGLTYIGQSMFSGVCVCNVTISGSSTAGLFLRAIKNSIFTNICIDNSTPNLSLEDCGCLGINNLLSYNSTGDGISIDNSLTISLNSCEAINNSVHGIDLTSNSFGIIINSCTCNSNDSNGININNASNNINIADSIFNNNQAKGINSEASTGSLAIKGCTIDTNGTDGIDFDGSDNIVESCVVINNGGNGVQAGANGVVSNNQIKNNGTVGVALTVDNNTIVTGNYISDNTSHGISGDDDNCVISSNRIIANGGNGILLSSGNNWSINSNNITGNTLDGINLTSDDSIIISNHCSGNGSNGIEIVSGSDNIVAGNNFRGNTGTNFINGGTATTAAANKT